MFELTRSGGLSTNVLSGARPKKAHDTHSLSIRAHKAIVGKVVAQRFVQARELNGMSQTEGAHALGYAKSGQLSLIESGRKSPPLAILVKASEAYRVSVDYLLGVCEDPDRDPASEIQLRIQRENARQLEDMSRTLGEALIHSTRMMDPTAQAARAFTVDGERLIAAFHGFLKVNREEFEGMRGGAPVMSALSKFEDALNTSRQYVARHQKLMDGTTRIVADPGRLAANKDIFDADI